MNNLISRRSLKAPHLARLPSKSLKGEKDLTASCPNSPAIKKAYRLVVLGSARTGKSSIVSRFLEEDFDERYIPTIENFHRKVYRSRGESYQLDIMDRSGNDPFPAARRIAYLNGDMFLLICSFDNPQSVTQLAEIYNNIVDCKSAWPAAANQGSDSPKIPVIFVVNKSDLLPAKREISLNQVLDDLKDVLSSPEQLVLCSASSNENITKIFGRAFTMGKLPKFMNPEHKQLRSELSEDGVLDRDRHHSIKNVLRRIPFNKESNDGVIVNKNLRRPSLRTDLLLSRAKSCSHLSYNVDTFSIPSFHSPHRTTSYSDSRKKKRENKSAGEAQAKNQNEISDKTDQQPNNNGPCQSTPREPSSTTFLLTVAKTTKRCNII